MPETIQRFIIFSVLPAVLIAITTIHHDKPENTTIPKMANKMKDAPDRQKRLLPYINYYTGPNYQKPVEYSQSERATPFLESNALPGPFHPMVNHQNPDYSEIYDKLVQLKQGQQHTTQNHHYQRPQINYVPVYQFDNTQHKRVQPSKTTIDTYTPTNIDITSPENDHNYENPRTKPVNRYVYKIFRPNPKPQYYEIPQHSFTPAPNYEEPLKVYYRPNQVHQYHQKPQEEIKKPLIYTIEAKPHKPQINTIIDDNYVAQKLTPVPAFEPLDIKQYQPVQFLPSHDPEPTQYHHPTPVPLYHTTPAESTNTLSRILKQLQDSNALPHTLTPDNIDNSIKTLVKILNGLKKQQTLSVKPIVVADDDNNSDEISDNDQSNYIPGTVSESFPSDTVEGGTPGIPGVDYPALSTIPPTSFNCKTQRYKGFFGDPDTNCQVWHYCDLNGGQASFLCPNGTIFSQVALTCDWWYNVKCATTTQLYVLNERLYKYILPLSPKFPEDYSGPLVDKYLALKFKEMEDKMNKEKVKEDDSVPEKDDSDQLQEINEKQNRPEET